MCEKDFTRSIISKNWACHKCRRVLSRDYVRTETRRVIRKRITEELKENKMVKKMKNGNLKTFKMIRKQDESGYSGIGHVLSGVVFENGKTVIQWVSVEDKQSIAIYPTFEIFKHFHIDGHPVNETQVIWVTEF